MGSAQRDDGDRRRPATTDDDRRRPTTAQDGSRLKEREKRPEGEERHSCYHPSPWQAGCIDRNRLAAEPRPVLGTLLLAFPLGADAPADRVSVGRQRNARCASDLPVWGALLEAELFFFHGPEVERAEQMSALWSVARGRMQLPDTAEAGKTLGRRP